MSALSTTPVRPTRRPVTPDPRVDPVTSGRGERPGASHLRLVGDETSTTTAANAGWAGIPAPRRGQRAFDVAIALPLAIITLPVLAVGAVLSALSFRAHPFFTQHRLGRDGEMLRFVKIRTLPPTAPAAADKYRIAKVETTRVGRLLRKTKFDELPQLWLVVAGHMSLVGPRPEMPTLAATFDPAFVAARTTVRPGITGFWQVSPASQGLIGEAPEYDLWYLANRSWRLDLWLLWRTLGPCLGWDSVTFDDVPAWCRRRNATGSVTLAAATG